MQYYNRSANKVLPVLPWYVPSEAVMRDYGIWPIKQEYYTGEISYKITLVSTISYNEDSDSYTKTWEAVPITLELLKVYKSQNFTKAFSTLDARAQRPSTTVLSALMYEAPIPEPDADFIWQLEAIKEENRALLAKLEAAQTWEEAVEITPWIPWESPNPASRQHSRATQNLSGTDNVHLPS